MIIFCQPVADDDYSVQGSIRGACDQCGSPVWVAPNSQASIKIAEESEVYTYLVCKDCLPSVVSHYELPTEVTVLGGVDPGERSRDELVDQLQDSGLDVE